MKIQTNGFNHLKNNSIGITIGSFDGVHKGHDFLLSRFKNMCTQKGIIPVVISFSPHPLVYIKKEENFILNSGTQKKEVLQNEYGISLIEISFDEGLREMSGEDFFTRFFEKLNELNVDVKLFYAGHDFSLGQGKEFDFKSAKKYLKDIELFQEEQFSHNNELIFSSSEVRKTLREGLIEKANFILGRPFKLTGKVITGNRIGRTLGFPTANLEFTKAQLLPSNGVYFTRCIHKGDIYKSIVNIGRRPTITDESNVVVEVNIFDFDKEIYGDEIEVEFFKKIRNEVKFSSKDELIRQIGLDKDKCREFSYYGRFALIGKSIQHSKSSKVYSKIIENDFLDYNLLEFPTEEEISLKKILKEYSYVSITAPYKNYVFRNCDLIELAPKIESVNAIKLVDEKIVGTNTDLLAMGDILTSLLKEDVENIFLIGDGAMGKVLSYLLEKSNREFKVLSRKSGNLEELSKVTAGKNLIINAAARVYTPTLSSDCEGIFWDLNYSQPYESTLKNIKKLKYIDGTEMLTLQAKYALSFWNLKTL